MPLLLMSGRPACSHVGVAAQEAGKCSLRSRWLCLIIVSGVSTEEDVEDGYWGTAGSL